MPFDVVLTVIALPVAAIVLWKRDVIRPGSARRAGVRDVGGAHWMLWVAGGLLIFLGAPLGGAAGAALHGAIYGDRVDAAAAEAMTALGSYTVGIGVCVALTVVLRPARSTERRWLGVGWRDPWRGLLAIVGTFPFVMAVNFGGAMLYRLIKGEDPPVLAHSTLDLIVGSPGTPWVWVLGALAVVGAPIAEEYMYRGMLQTAVLRVTGNVWGAVGVTSLVFAASHAGVVPWYGLPALLMLGVALGLAFERFKSLGVPIAMHAVFNAVNLAMAVAG